MYTLKLISSSNSKNNDRCSGKQDGRIGSISIGPFQWMVDIPHPLVIFLSNQYNTTYRIKIV